MMRELIEPALNIMARTGLFLSIVAWVVGQWWEIEVTGTCGSATMTWPGYLMSFHTEGWYPFKIKYLDLSQIESWQSFGGSFNLFEVRCEVPGIGFMPQSNLVMAMLTVGHWLVVSILILMNIALCWFHRKPKGVTPCKS